jgi:hypothetical protein
MRRALLFIVAGVSVYLVAPSVLGVFSSWPDVRDLDPLLLQFIVIAQIGAFVCLWQLLRVTLGERDFIRSEYWLPIPVGAGAYLIHRRRYDEPRPVS